MRIAMVLILVGGFAAVAVADDSPSGTYVEARSCSVFAGTTDGEVFCSDDGGDHWSPVISGLAPISKAGHDRALGRA